MLPRRNSERGRPGRGPWTALACIAAVTAAGSVDLGAPAARGADLIVAGRATDRSPAAQTHQVFVGDDFFSPASLTINVGDEVRWSKSTSGHHNVQSCAGEQLGCNGATANESFSNGAPRSTPWFYVHTFVQPGTNPYFCLSHISFMTGTVDVVGPSANPPPVPDGGAGAPMTVTKLDSDGDDLAVSWDAASCSGAMEYSLLFGVGSGFPASSGGIYALAGSVCDLAGPAHEWLATPDPTTDPTGLLWWVVVATDGAEREGSWGTDGTEDERDGPGIDGSSEQCSVVTKDLSNTCDP